MKLSEAVSEMGRRFDKSSELDKFQVLAKPAINLAYLDVGKSWRWPQLESSGSVLAIPIVEGTTSIVQDSQTVSIASADTAWKGRFFRVKGGENDYRIVYVSGTTVTLDQPIIEDSGSITYEIEKRFYTLPTEVREIGPFDASSNNVVTLDNRGIRSTFPNYDPRILDIPFHVHGADKFTDVYQTGSATVTKDSDIVTGTLTAWLANAKPGNIFVFSNTEYRIRRVETDTRIVLYNLVGATATGQSYKINPDQPMTVRLRGTFLRKSLIPFNYTRTVYPLVHDDDRIELSEEAKIATLAFAEAHLAKSLGKDDWANRLLEAQGRLRVAQELAKPTNPAFTQFSPLIPRGNGR